jgi:lipoprotein-anchoring transpeptidase ErfK/SrfK
MKQSIFNAALVLFAAIALAGCDVPPPTEKLASPGANKVYAVVDLSDQDLTVVRGLEDGDATEQHQFTVSTGIDRKRTPTGHFYPDFLSPDHVSSIYHVPMPWSVFFNGNIAIHGDPDTRLLGTPASNGCVRVAPDEAEIFYRMVEEVGLRNTTIVVRE